MPRSADLRHGAARPAEEQPESGAGRPAPDPSLVAAPPDSHCATLAAEADGCSDANGGTGCSCIGTCQAGTGAAVAAQLIIASSMIPALPGMTSPPHGAAPGQPFPPHFLPYALAPPVAR